MPLASTGSTIQLYRVFPLQFHSNNNNMEAACVEAKHVIVGELVVGASGLCWLHNYSLWRDCGQSADTRPGRNILLQNLSTESNFQLRGGLRLEILRQIIGTGRLVGKRLRPDGEGGR